MYEKYNLYQRSLTKSYQIPFRAILPSMESRGVSGQEIINHYHGNGSFEKVTTLLNYSETISNLLPASRLYRLYKVM